MWPAFPSPRAANQLAVQFQLEHSQWLTAEEIRSRQLQQLTALIEFSRVHVPHYRDSAAFSEVKTGKELSWDLFRQLPILSRVEVQRLGDALAAQPAPPHHGQINTVKSSGSTGRPVTINKTGVCNLFFKAFSLRFHLWHQRDFDGTFAAIRYTDNDKAVPPLGVKKPGWGPGTVNVVRTGPTWLLSSSTDVAEQIRWLQRIQPHYLMTYPSILLQLARRAISKQLALPTLRQVCTVGEALPAGIRAASRDAWGVALADTYSSEETGWIAIQCPDTESHHVQAEGILLEILNENNDPCAPGQTGRVVVTPLHNFATPLIRYEIGDYAQLGHKCSCGRGLPVLSRIIGRTRNMARLPDGRLFRPSVGIMEFAEIGPVRQAQLIQHALDQVEVKLVVDGILDRGQERRIESIVRKNFDYPMGVTFSYPHSIPKSARDKFEDFLSEIV